MAERACEAPIHSPDCSGVGVTRDHFTPKAIAKILGWTPTQIGAQENLQYLSPECHRDKDKTTPHRLQILRRQLNGELEVRFGQHQQLIRLR